MPPLKRELGMGQPCEIPSPTVLRAPKNMLCELYTMPSPSCVIVAKNSRMAACLSEPRAAPTELCHTSPMVSQFFAKPDPEPSGKPGKFISATESSS